jgi:hypothetical protein
LKNKQGEDGEVVRNMTRLVARGFSQVDDLDFRENFAPIAHLVAIMIFLAFAASKGFELYQMDVKNIFLNGVIQDEVYVRQPQVSRTTSILIECTSSQKLCTCLSKCLRHGILGLKLSSYIMGM